MNKDNDKERSLLIRILSNGDIQKGMVFFVAALILAFVAVTPATSTNVTEGTREEDGFQENERINYPVYDIINATLELEIISDSGSANVQIENETHVALNEYSLIGGGDQEIIDLVNLADETEQTPAWLNFTVEEGILQFSLIFTYTGSPYGILSLPAALFTLIGMVYAFKGKGVILGEIQMKKMEEEARKQQKEGARDIVEEESRSEEGTDKVIYDGDDTTEHKGEADHINFMGIPDEEEEKR